MEQITYKHTLTLPGADHAANLRAFEWYLTKAEPRTVSNVWGEVDQARNRARLFRYTL